MQSFLYCEEDFDGVPSGNFQIRYFQLLPFCGLRWSFQKTLENDTEAKQENANSSWLFGGRIKVEKVTKESAITYDSVDPSVPMIYPFLLYLRFNDDVTQIRLASTSEMERETWLQHIQQFSSMQNYLIGCSEFDCVPSKKIFDAVSNVKHRSGIDLEDELISISSLLSIQSYINLSTPHGSVLQLLKLKHCALDDSHAQSLSAILNLTPHLYTLCLAENNLSDKGITELSSSIVKIKSLKDIDLAGNNIGDSGFNALIQSLVLCEDLKTLDMSRNILTAASIKPLTSRLATHSSKFSHLGLAYNNLGDGVAAVVTLLMHNKPSLLQVCDISFCGMTDLGVREISSSIPFCTSLRSLILRGNFVAPNTMVQLIESVAQHQNNFSSYRRGNLDGMTLHVGGVENNSCSPKCLPFQSIRRSVPHIGDRTLLRHVLMRKKIMVDNEDKNIEDMMPLVKMRIKLPSYLYTVEEVLDRIIEFIGAYTGQLRIISMSDFDNISRTCYLVFTLDEPSQESDYLRSSGVFVPKVYRKLSPKNMHEIFVRSIPLQQPSVNEMLEILRSKAESSDYLLQKLGVQTLSIKLPSADDDFSLTFNYDIKTLVDKLDHEYLPALTPMALSQGDVIASEIETDVNDQSLHNLASLRLLKEQLDRAEIFSSKEKSKRLMEESMRKREKRQSNISKRIERRNHNELLIVSIRDLKKNNEIGTNIAQFWEGALGNASYKPFMMDELKLALNENGIFHAVGQCQQLFNAMHVRDMPIIATSIMKVKDENLTLNGAVHIKFGERLLSDLLTIQRDAINLHSLAHEAEDVAIVEDFLLTCGKAGYGGPEMFAAVELRQKLVIIASKENPELMKTEIDFIKHRALLSNLLISRDFEGLKNALKNVSELGDERVLGLPEVFAAKKLIQDSTGLFADVKEAIRSKNIINIIEVLANAAYLGLSRSDELISRAEEELSRLSSNPKTLLFPVLIGLRENNLLAVDDALSTAFTMGWRISALASNIPAKIIRKKIQLGAEEEVKSQLIRLALSIKNGFRVNLSELFQLMRKAKKMNLAADPSLHVYFRTVHAHMSKNAGLCKQEEAIQRMIEENNIDGLEELLSGRGTGKLVVNAPSMELAAEWMDILSKAAENTLPEGSAENDVLMVGTMEKAARSDTGTLRGWRHRYFILQNGVLSYFTSRGGEKKGAVRVIGGKIRPLTSEDVAGRQYSFELQEGKDMSVIDEDLLEEARKLVTTSKIGGLERAVDIAIRSDSIETIKNVLKQISAADEVNLHFVRKAKENLKKLENRKLKLDLRKAARNVIPGGYMQELIQNAMHAQIDPNNFLLSHLIKIAGQSEVTQYILRARGAMLSFDEIGFRRSITALSRFDVKRFSMRDSRMITAVVIQHSAYKILRNHDNGENLTMLCRFVVHALSCCRAFMVETEPMQLGRLLVSLNSHSNAAQNTQIVSTGLNSYADESKKMHTHNNSQYSLDRFPNLSVPEAVKSSVTSSAFFSWKKKAPSVNEVASQAAITDMLSFSSKPITKPLLNDLSSSDRSYSLKAFIALQAVMGDCPLKKVVASKDNILKPRGDVAWVASDLCEVGRNNALLRDELYIQICKQISGNSKVLHRLRGCLLFSAYIHAFPPSTALLPYLKNFMTNLSANEAAMISTFSEIDPNSEDNYTAKDYKSKRDELSTRHTVIKIVTYCLKVLNKVESFSAAGDKLMDISRTHGGKFAGHEMDREVAGCILGRASLTFQVLLMTGSIFQFTLQYGDLDTPFSLVPLLYGRMVGGPNELHDISESSEFPNKKNKNQDSWSNWLLKQFRGFAFYELPESTDGYNINDIPVQPNEDDLVEWDADILWRLLKNRVENTREEISSLLEKKDIETIISQLDSRSTKTFVLRKRIGMNSEKLADQFELFNDQVSDRDIVNLRQMWVDFLLEDEKPPSDDHRVDLLFADESRCVNANLFGGGALSRTYLIALQLALSWVEGDSYDFGEGDDGVLNVDISVRPNCKNIYHKRNPNFSIIKPMIVGDKKNTTHRAQTSRVSAYFRRSMPGGEDALRIGKILKRKMRLQSMTEESDEFKEDTAAKAVAEVEKEIEFEMDEDNESTYSASEYDPSEYDYDEYENTVDGSEDDYSVKYSDEESLISRSEGENSSVDEEKTTAIDNDAEYMQRRRKSAITSMEDLLPYELAEIEQKIMDLGIDLDADSIDLEDIVDWISKFHSIAVDNDLELESARYRYMLKRAYIHYTTALPFYGNNFVDTVYMSKDGPREVIFAVSPNGVRMIDPHEWSCIMSAPIYDIEDCFYFSERQDVGEDDESTDSTNELHGPRLVMTINGLKIELISPRAGKQLKEIKRCVLEALARGAFPHGTEGGNDILDVGESIVPISDCKDIMRRYVREFPLIAVPPTPAQLSEAPDYFDVPKSRREIMIEERAEEELLELEQSRLAAETLVQKMQQQQARGRKDLQSIQKDDSDSDASDSSPRRNLHVNDNKSATAINDKRDSLIARKSSMTTANLQSKISNAACGVPSGKESTVVNVPTKRNGKLKLEKIERVKHAERPVLRRTAVPDPKVVPASFDTSTANVKDVLSAFGKMSTSENSDDEQSIAESAVHFSHFAQSFSGRARGTVSKTNTIEQGIESDDYLPLTPKKKKF